MSAMRPPAGGILASTASHGGIDRMTPHHKQSKGREEGPGEAVACDVALLMVITNGKRFVSIAALGPKDEAAWANPMRTGTAICCINEQCKNKQTRRIGSRFCPRLTIFDSFFLIT